MEASINRDVLESYVFCKYKSYLKLIGQQGDKSDYERLLIAARSKVKLSAIDNIYVKNQDNQVVRNIVLTTSLLEQGPSFVLEAIMEDDHISISIDGLKKVSGVSNLGQFIYIPMLFHGGYRVHKEQRLLLELYAFSLLQYQAILPSSGIIWYGRECKTTTVHLNSDLRKAKKTLVLRGFLWS